MNEHVKKNKEAFISKTDSTNIARKGILWQFEEELLLARERGLTYKQIASIVSEITSQQISARAVNYYIARRLKNKKNLYKNKQINSETLPQTLSNKERLALLQQKTQKRS